MAIEQRVVTPLYVTIFHPLSALLPGLVVLT